MILKKKRKKEKKKNEKKTKNKQTTDYLKELQTIFRTRHLVYKCHTRLKITFNYREKDILIQNI